MLVYDICAGAGGLSYGLKLAGFNIGLAIEVDGYAANTYKYNFPDVTVLQEDVRHVTREMVQKKLRDHGGLLGVLVAGLPCQGFSESNRKTRHWGNPRNHLYREFRRLLCSLSPRWFIIENVAGLATLESGIFLERILRSLRSAGYKVVWKVLDASEFGVPQIRRRAFIVGNRVGLTFSFPDSGTIRTQTPVTVREAISDLPELRNGANVDCKEYRFSWEYTSNYVKQLRERESMCSTGHIVSCNSSRVLERYRYIEAGDNWKAIPSHLMGNYTDLSNVHTGIYHRLSWSYPAKVIGNFRKNMLIHPSEQRGLSIREAARLQSFPDGYEFLGPLNDRQQQVGDAVPPLLAKVVSDAVKRADSTLHGEL